MRERFFAIPLNKFTACMIAACAVWLIACAALHFASDKLDRPRLLKIWRIVNAAAAAATVIIILTLTLLERSKMGARQSMLEPFHTIKLAFKNASNRQEKLLNVYVFIPFGAFISAALEGRVKLRPAVITIAGMIFSLIVETSQYIFYLGQAETDDVITNTAGTLIGVLLCVIGEFIVKTPKKRLLNKKK